MTTTHHNPQNSISENDLQELALQIEELSVQPEDYPTLINNSLITYTEQEVHPEDFSSDLWLKKIIAVQAWLNLDAPLLQADTLLNNLSILFSSIYSENHKDCFSINADQSFYLTEEGFDALALHVDKSLKLKEKFLESVEDGNSLPVASKEWDKGWEDDTSLRHHYISNLSAKVETYHIRYFRDLATDKELNLNPSYQRDVVWSLKDSQKLIESILRGIPLPSVILSEVGRVYQIVDGKQRLTSILRFMGSHPACHAYIESIGGNIEDFIKDHDKFIRKHRIKAHDLNAHFFPFKLGKFKKGDPLEPLSGKYYTDINKKELEIGGEETTVHGIFTSGTCPYKIPTIIYKKTLPQDIHHVFGLYNKQGKKLNAEEIRNAAHHNLHMTKLLLALSGDKPGKDNIDELAPFISEKTRALFPEVAEFLEGMGFGTARFKRTKVLSWVTAILFHKPNGRDGQFSTPSTANHITNFLINIEEGNSQFFVNNNVLSLQKYTDEIIKGIELFDDQIDFWPTSIRSKNQLPGKWEELPLVACLTAVILASILAPEKLINADQTLIRNHFELIKLPEKTQNKTQWQFIATIAIDFLNQLEIDNVSAQKTLETLWGYNCIPTLKTIAATADNGFYCNTSSTIS